MNSNLLPVRPSFSRFVTIFAFVFALGCPISHALVVTTDVDESDFSSGGLSLREAISQANSAGVPVTITFSNNTNNGAVNFYAGAHTIRLNGGELPIHGSVTIDGPGANLLAVDGNHSSDGGSAQSGGSFLTGNQFNTTGGSVAIASIDVANALPSATYTFSGSGTSLTLTRSGDFTAQTIDVSSGVAPNDQVNLNFWTLGISVIVVADSGGKTGAGLITDFAGSTIVTGSSNPSPVINGRVFRVEGRTESSSNSVAVGNQFNTTGGSMTIVGVDVSSALPGAFFTLSSSGTSLTLTRNDNVAQTLNLSSYLGANGTVTLRFPVVGVSITIAADSGGKTAAGIATDLAGGTISVPIVPVNSVTISGLTIINGRSNDDFIGGGAILNDHASMIVSECMVNTCSAITGAGIYNDGTFGRATLEIVNSTIAGNNSQAGTGVFNNASGGNATTTVVNSTFSNNSATYGGGGIYSYGGNAGTSTVTILNSTFSGNVGNGFGASVFSNDQGFGRATVEVGNSIFNASASDPNIINPSGVVISDGYNLCSDAAGGDSLTGPGGFLDITGDQRNTNPLLDPLGLQNNGGPTQTIALQSTSPAIDAGDPVFDPNAFIPPLTTDQRGSARIVNGRIDIGAFEVYRPLAATPIISPGSGTYRRLVRVVISDSTPGAVIHYTIDGSTPTSSSPVYVSGTGRNRRSCPVIQLRQSATVKAIAIANGFSNSPVAQASYILQPR